jgi:hypothetical protein
MQRKATKDEAAKFIAQCGDAAYEQALEAERAARRQRNMRLARFLEKVARRIALDSAKRGRRMPLSEVVAIAVFSLYRHRHRDAGDSSHVARRRSAPPSVDAIKEGMTISCAVSHPSAARASLTTVSWLTNDPAR